MSLWSRVPSLLSHFRPGLLRRLGSLGWVLLVEPLAMRLALALATPERRGRKLVRRLGLRAELRRWETRRGEILAAGKSRPRASLDDLGLAPEQLRALRARLAQENEVVVADVDQDGFYLSHFGPLGELPTVGPQEYLPRLRYQVQLVARQDGVGIKKSYAGRTERFLNELHALHTLAGAGCRVPAILNVDFDRLAITLAWIPGEVLRERLAEQSVVIRDRDVARDPAYAALMPEEQRDRCIENGARVIRRVVDEPFLDEVYRQLQLVHRARIAWNDVKTGNVLIEKRTGLPWLIDFDAATDCRRMNRFSFRVLSDADVEAFNRHFGCDRWTYRRIQACRRGSDDGLLPGPLYAPAYVGCGVRFGRIWSIGSGSGRWQYILKENLPSLEGKRVLDLGANNALTSLEMLRAGAREVVAVELSDEAIRQGEALRRLYEWADHRPYNLRYVRANMAELPQLDLGRFDLAIALCSLYYLDAEQMRRVTQYLSRHAPAFVLQANHNTALKRPDPEIDRKSRIEYLEELLRTNGFADTTVVAYRGYLRPLVIGRVDSSAVQRSDRVRAAA